MKRNILKDLTNWKNRERRKPLIVRGARQIGKTWAIQEFAKHNYESFIKIDLEKNIELHSVFENDLDPQNIISSLEIALNQRIIQGETLLFIDEIQACPRAIQALRYFYEEMPKLHVITAGSLLEFALSDISFPVGRVQLLYMFPLNFYEYLCAIGKDQLAQKIKEKPCELPTVIHNMLLEELKKYFFIGGMPECVTAYIKTKSLLEAFEVQSEIIETYRQDFSKYGIRIDTTCLNEILSRTAEQVGEQIQYTKLDSHHTGPTNKKAFDLLCLARVLSKVPACTQGKNPLGGSVNHKKFKALVLDIGLMQRLNQLPVHVEMEHADLLDIYRGKLAEQFVGQELKQIGSAELFYWARDKKGSEAEVDYIIQNSQGEIVPIEVKSGAAGSLKSLHSCLKTFPEIKKGFILCSGKYKELAEQKITFVPLYYAESIFSHIG
jgi:uncharacterized protein